MGCDIHSIAQVHKQGKWETAEAEIAGDDRDYRTFAILADVRNGSGITPLSQPRGLPDDVSVDGDHMLAPHNPELKGLEDFEREAGRWMGDHSHSWFLLSELKSVARPKEILEWMSWSLPKIVKELERIREENKVTDSEVRYVFGFDN